MPRYQTPESIGELLAGRRGYQAAEEARSAGVAVYRLFGNRCLTSEGHAYVSALQETRTALTWGVMRPPVPDDLRDAVVSTIDTTLESFRDVKVGMEQQQAVSDTYRALGDLGQFDIVRRAQMAEEASRSPVLGA